MLRAPSSLHIERHIGVTLSPRVEFEKEVAGRFGILPNFFRSAQAAPELVEELWGFAKSAYLDNPMPSVFKERLFVWLSRLCPIRYCIVRHVGFLLGEEHGHSSGDPAAAPQSVQEIVALLRRPSPWQRDMSVVYEALERSGVSDDSWPAPGSEDEDALFACAALVFAEPARSKRARLALRQTLGDRRFEFFGGLLAFIRTAHYWTILHPEIETESDMQILMAGHEELARLLIEDAEAGRCDVDQRLFAELADLRDLNERRELERAKAELEEKDRQKDAFIAILAHELRNPLAAIRAAADALSIRKLRDPAAGQLLERLNRQTNAMARMLEDLLDASRIGNEKVSVHLEPLSLSDILTETIQEHQPLAAQVGLQMTLLGGGEPCFVRADRVRLRQILDNLCSNAIQFTPSGGRIELELELDDDHANVRVSDTGIGFGPKFTARLFEPFTQEERPSGRVPGGLGLGLAIASRLAGLQGGVLTAESAGADQGAVFTLRLPVSQAGPDAVVAGVEDRHDDVGVVLFVEDNKDLADSVAEVLQAAGYTVRIAGDGPHALALLRTLTPDLIICDLGLPGEMDGYALARAIRAEQRLSATRLVALSGQSSAEAHAKVQAAGFEGLVTKPVTRDALLRMARSPAQI